MENENNELIVKLPRLDLSDQQLENLRLLVFKKESLLKTAFQTANLEIIEEEGVLSFPWFTYQDGEDLACYAAFASSLITLAKKLKHVNKSSDKDEDNSSYSFRCFLLRLGFIGEEYKGYRKLLMKNFPKGNSSFRKKDWQRRSLDSKTLKELRAKYPKGTRVRLVKMDDVTAPRVGTLGTVSYVDDIGSLVVDWDDGKLLNVLYLVDECEIEK